MSIPIPEDIKRRLEDEVALFFLEHQGIPLDDVINFAAKITKIVEDYHCKVEE